MGKTQQLGLIINPVAGMGGSIGLKGTDGKFAAQARELGAVPIAESRAIVALSQLVHLCPHVNVLTCPGAMGAAIAERNSLNTRYVCDPISGETSARDTKVAAHAMLECGVDLLLFVGGDGTACDILEVVGRDLPVLGVPSGVKMHSAVFAASARAAGEVAGRYLKADDRESLLSNVEILDRVDRGNLGNDISPSLLGVVRAPRLGILVPAAKASRPVAETHALEGAIVRISRMLHEECITLIGPGSTMQLLEKRLGFDGSLLGVDAARNGHLLEGDLGEHRILELIAGKPARIVVSIVGGQGFLFGRGNQQISASVISQVGPENIIVVSSLEKLASLPEHCLLVDTGDESIDDLLAGYLPVFVSDARTVMMPVKNVSRET